jgi:hypothetical protein
MQCEVAVGERDVIADLHLVEQPVRIALEYFCEVDADITGRLAKSVHDAAEGGFMNSQHSGQAVLADTGGIHAQFQVWVDISIQAHRALALFCFVSCGKQVGRLLEAYELQSACQTREG